MVQQVDESGGTRQNSESLPLLLFDQEVVVTLLDSLPGMDTGASTTTGQMLMLLVSMCVLHEQFGLAG